VKIFKVGSPRPDRNIGLDIEGSYFLVEGLGSSPGAMCLNQQNTLKRSVGNTVWYAAEFAWYVNHQNLPT
jgi:hypothetical protein